MRGLLALPLALLLLALLPPPAAAQASPLLEDPAGDVRLELSGTPGPSPAAVYPAVDLRSLTVSETKAAFAFRLAAAALPSDKDPGADGVLYRVTFEHNGRQFLLDNVMAVPSVQPQVFTAFAYRDSPDADWSLVWFSDSAALVDRTANTLTVEIQRDEVSDTDGTAPLPGRSLSAIRVRASAILGEVSIGLLGNEADFPQDILDDMPDDPAAGAEWPSQVGPAQTGHARLSAKRPFRSSNGEATTFVYEVTATNIGAERDTFELAALGVPAGYSAVLPVPVVALDAGASAAVPVLLTMPFGHQHGEASSFVLEMRSVGDPGSVGRIEMGVRFLAVPQPAGHHDTVYLHRAPTAGGLGPFFGFRSGFLNTLEEDPADAGGNYYSGFNIDFGGWSAIWFYDLQPSLLMGIDVDPGKTGRLSLPMGSTVPIREASVSATLFWGNPYEDWDEATVVAAMEPTAPADLMPNAPVLTQGELRPADGVGRLPFQPGANLWLVVEMTGAGPVPPTLNAYEEGPYAAPGGFAQLPLREWHDDVDDVLTTAGGPGLSALGTQERLVNPGEAVVFPVSEANPLGEAVTVRFEVSGGNAAWASLPAGSLTVPAHGTAQASVVVLAPASARDQERADLVLQAWSKDHPEARGLLRLVAEVDTDADQPDDTAAAGELAKKESPTPAPAFVAVGLAVAAFALRRRR